MISKGQSQERDSLIERFNNRANTGASFVGAYVDDVFQSEQRLIQESGPDIANPDEFVRTTNLMRFTAAVLLDPQGRTLAVAPVSSDLIGQNLTGKYKHLAGALAGRRTVSDVVPSAVKAQPIVAFALPVTGKKFGVFSAGFSLNESPLRAFLERQPIHGTRGYILDSKGTPIVAAGDGADAAGARPVTPSEADRDGRLLATASIPGTPWTYLLDAPKDKVLAPVSQGDRGEWGLLTFFAAVGLAGMVATSLALASRARARADKAASDQRLRLTVENAPIGMTLVDLDHRFVEPNRRLCEMLGYSFEELTTLTFDQVTHPADLDLDLGLVEQLAAGKIDNYELEKRYVRHDGSQLLGRLTVSAIRDQHGKTLYFVSQIEDNTEFHAAQEQLKYRAHYDPLTGLANRSLLMDRLSHALSDPRGPAVGLAFCDIDYFKQVNDTHGHRVGDTVLAQVAKRLQAAVRHCDTVARIGGDEFVILMIGVEELRQAEELLNRVMVSFHEPIDAGGGQLPIGLSAGLAMSEPGDSADRMLHRADQALYLAKQNGRGRVETHQSKVPVPLGSA